MTGVLERAYRWLVDSEALEGRDEDQLKGEPRQFFRHVFGLTVSKAGDGLIDPKLVLAWLLASHGAPALAIGWLVPVREAGALLPQLALSARVQHARRFRVIWSAGALGQGVSALGIAFAAAHLHGPELGFVAVAIVAVFALFRSLCSVTYRPLQARTLAPSTRGTSTGLAGTLAAIIVLTFGGLLTTGIMPLTSAVVILVFCAAAGLWALAALSMLGLREDPEPSDLSREDPGGPPTPARGFLGAVRQLRLLKTDPQLRRFTSVRALLTVTSLAPPFIVTTRPDGLPGQLGPFLLASALASVLSAYVWGRLADRSSRTVLMASGCLAAVILGAVALGLWLAPDAVHREAGLGPWNLPVALFVLMIAHQGVRLGRATHLVDMPPKGQHAAYTAVSNTVIGLVLVAGGAFGWVAHASSEAVVLGLSAACALLAPWGARALSEVQVRGRPNGAAP